MRDPLDAPYDFAREKYEADKEYRNSDEYLRDRHRENDERATAAHDDEYGDAYDYDDEDDEEGDDE